jgi:hypothetical protein
MEKKNLRKKAIYVTIYSMTSAGLPKDILREVDLAVTRIVKKYGDIAVDFKHE